MAKREFLQLAHKYEVRYDVAGWYVSEKLDGMRCFWDGGISRGITKSHVPWANTAKDDRYIEPPVATGLWSRYGNVIHAPDAWLDCLPPLPLDGELYIGKEQRQRLMSCVKQLVPGDDWGAVRFHVFDSPTLRNVLRNGFIDGTNYSKSVTGSIDWCKQHTVELPFEEPPYASVYTMLRERKFDHVIQVVNQVALPQFNTLSRINRLLDAVSDCGGEGLIIRDPYARYVTARTRNMLKVKRLDDAEGTVIGYVTGRATDKGSKLLGLMGALVLRLDNGATMELSGFTEAERRLTLVHEIDAPDAKDVDSATQWAQQHPETKCPDWIQAVAFPRGSRVTFRYRGLSRDKIPQEARYWRKKED